jgi:hypothetical protein
MKAHVAMLAAAICAGALLLACDPPTERTSARAPLVHAAPRLVVVSKESPSLPGGHDAPPLMTVAFELGDGMRIPVDRRAVSFVERWRDGAALVDREGKLYEVSPDGARRMLAASVVGELAVSRDEQLLAYAATRGFLGELRVHDGRRERVLVSQLSSAGVFGFGSEDLAFVGARPGGIAGVWLAPLDGSNARCLTNCDLRTGEPWMHRFVEPPTRASTFEWLAGSLAWIDANGDRHEVLVEGGAVQ